MRKGEERERETCRLRVMQVAFTFSPILSNDLTPTRTATAGIKSIEMYWIRKFEYPFRFACRECKGFWTLRYHECPDGFRMKPGDLCTRTEVQPIFTDVECA